MRMQDLIMSDDAGRARVERAHERREGAANPPESQRQGGGATPGPQESREPRREDHEGQAGVDERLPPPPRTLPPPAPATGTGPEDRLRDALRRAGHPIMANRGSKRPADTAPDDPRASGTDDAEVLVDRFGESPDRGTKRRADEPPDDPRLVAGGAESEVVNDLPAP